MPAFFFPGDVVSVGVCDGDEAQVGRRDWPAGRDYPPVIGRLMTRELFKLHGNTSVCVCVCSESWKQIVVL